MRLDSIAVKHLLRCRGKSIFLVLIIAVAMGAVTGLYALTTAMKEEISKSFDEIGPNIIIKPGEGNQGFSYGGAFIPAMGEIPAVLTNDSILAVRSIPEGKNIAVVGPKIVGSQSFEGQSVTIVGIDFPNELKLKSWWTYLGEVPSQGKELLAGYGIAKTLNWSLGQRVEIGGADFQVTGILKEQGTDDDQVIFMQLLKAQELLDKPNQLSFIELSAYCNTCPLPEIAQQLRDVLPGTKVMILAETVKARELTVDRLSLFALILSAIVVGAGALVILLTAMSGVSERTAEIGIYRAMGFRQRNVFEILLTEALLLGFAGGFLGYGIGMGLARLLAPSLGGIRLYIAWQPFLGTAIVLGAVIITLLASLYPAIKGARQEPMQALRFI